MMAPLEQAPGEQRHRAQQPTLRHRDGDLIQLRLRKGARSTDQRRRQRNVDIEIDVARRETIGGLRASRTIAHHSHHPIPVRSQLQPLAHRRLEVEELALDTVAQHAHPRAPLHVGNPERRSLRRAQPEGLEVAHVHSHHGAASGPVVATHVEPAFALRADHHPLGNQLPQRRHVAPRETAREGGAIFVELRAAALGCAHEDVVDPERGVLAQRLVARPGADREHGDHRRHAEDDPHRGQ